MADFLLTSLVIFGVMVGWLYVQDLYRRFARRHPELGPFRREGGCGGGCSCRQGSCPTGVRVPPARIVALPDARHMHRLNQRSKEQ